jgi:hypothetical protein
MSTNLKQSIPETGFREMMSCENTSALVSLSMDSRVPIKHRVMVKLHLFLCKGCRKTIFQYKFVRDVTRQIESVIMSHHSPERLDDEVARRINQEILRSSKSGNRKQDD